MSVINQLLKEQYQEQFPGTQVEVDAHGTDAALEALLKDEIDLAAIGRPLTAAEKAKGLIEIPLSQERIAVIIGRDNPFKGNLTVDQFVKIMRGEITDWSEVGGLPGAIRVIDRPASSDTRIALSRYSIFQNGGLITGENAMQLEQDDTAAVIQELGKDGIGYAIASQLVNQDKAKIIKLVVMHEALPDDPLYPYAQPRGYAYRKTPDLAASSFLGLATAAPGQAAIAAAKTNEAQAVVDALKPAPMISILKTADPETSAFAQTIKLIPFWLRIVLPLGLLGLILQWVLKRLESKPSVQPAVRPLEPATESDRPMTASLVSDEPASITTLDETETPNDPEIPFAKTLSPDLSDSPPIPDEATKTLSIEPQPTTSPLGEAALLETVNPTSSVVSIDGSVSDFNVERFKQALGNNLLRFQGKSPETATLQDFYIALAHLVRDRLLQLNTVETYVTKPDVRWVGELSAEYLPGPYLQNNLVNLGIVDSVRQGLQELGQNLKTIAEQEEEPGLGKGGLGQLMVCYLDSLSTQGIPAIGYGIRYEYGIFDQEIQDGWQVEVPDTWLQSGNPWDVERPEGIAEVMFGGHTEAYLDEQGRYRVRWIPQEVVKGFPYDTPIVGYRTSTVSLLRLWRAETSGTLCKTLYPVDVDVPGRILRLKQQCFLISCSLQDAIRLHLLGGTPIERLDDRFHLQLNDTDTALAVAELMRLLVDEHGVEWQKAWDVTRNTLSYTNHSLMPETLDDLWSIAVLNSVLPRHLEIIFEINGRFLEEVGAQHSDDIDRLRRLSLINETGDRYVRLTHLAFVGSHVVNGTSKLHTELLEQKILPDFQALYPEKFSTVTNGISPRRFLLLSNPRLAELISRTIGDRWITNLPELKNLETKVEDWQFRNTWKQVKQAVKQDLASLIQQQTGINVNPDSLFDVQAMVVHEYKRQHLNLLHILTLYNRIKANPNLDVLPRTFIFSGKAAPDYFTAKLIIKLIHSIASVVNADPDVAERLKIVFLPNFTIKSAQRLFPAADLSEHLSLAGTEAADTGNMIAALNGALIIGSPDGSNLEIRQEVGVENGFQFGLTAQEAAELQANGYAPMDIYNANAELKAAIDLLTSGTLSNGDTELFRPLVHLLLSVDQYLLLADYQSYIDVQEQVSQAYRDSDAWICKSILNTARIGKFSSDRAIHTYRDLWHIQSVATLQYA